jgi:hypothetical protein
MEKKYLVGGLAIVGAIALFMYLKPKGKKTNSDGFYNAQGMSPFFQQTSDRNKNNFHNASGKNVRAYYKR